MDPVEEKDITTLTMDHYILDNAITCCEDKAPAAVPTHSINWAHFQTIARKHAVEEHDRTGIWPQLTLIISPEARVVLGFPSDCRSADLPNAGSTIVVHIDESPLRHDFIKGEWVRRIPRTPEWANACYEDAILLDVAVIRFMRTLTFDPRKSPCS